MRNEEPDQGGVARVQVDKEWSAINITVDSGAVETVGPKCIATEFPTLETEASQMGMFCRAANDTKIAIHVKKALTGYTT